jgi:hypothetical protein
MHRLGCRQLPAAVPGLVPWHQSRPDRHSPRVLSVVADGKDVDVLSAADACEAAAALLALAATSDRVNEVITLHLQAALQAATALE